MNVATYEVADTARRDLKAYKTSNDSRVTDTETVANAAAPQATTYNKTEVDTKTIETAIEMAIALG